MGVLPIPLDLRRSGEPLCKTDDRLGWFSEVPAVDIAINSTRGKDIWMMGREVDISDGVRMSM